MEPIKIGDKEYTVEQITGIISEHEGMKTQFGKVGELSGKLGVSPDEFATQSQAAFDVLMGLQDRGIIDSQGKIIEKSAPTPAPATPTPPASPTPPKAAGVPSADDIAALAIGKAEDRFKQLERQIASLTDSNRRFTTSLVKSQIRQRYPSLDDEEIEIVMAKAASEGKDLFEVAKVRAEKFDGIRKGGVESFAKTHKLDLDGLNKRSEMLNQEGGVATAVTEGKKISFKKGEGAITPLQATEEHFKMLG